MSDTGWVVAGRPPEVLDAGPVELRRWEAGDVAELHAAVIASQVHLAPWMPWAADYDRPAAETYIASATSGWEGGTSFDYSMRDADGRVTGSCGLMTRQGEGIMEIGYWVSADRIRRGFAAASASTLTGAALALQGVERVEIHHDEANVASGAVPRRLGFELIRREEAEPVAPGESGVTLVWSTRSAPRPQS